ncbi:sulfotransferase [Actibacterium sp. 188UL27-1]|uniref:sulfotransferase n=1 Tax=Actibacterium sp. 188UL27-1 TaxID=2786961 RepID=UPI00195E423C|nr:sulfotransferase [Actibacterium sp. 188UL27-1]MBM7070101.1 hypothetical protein [Actibacterium sp. 188UL27-1]
MDNIHPVKATLNELRNKAIHLRSRLVPTGYEDHIHWLFIATLPNSGSTALAQLLASAPAAVSLTSNGEGAWMIPALHGPERSNPDLPLNYHQIKAVWTNRIAKKAPKPCVVVEKSPTNIVRMKEMIAGFAPSQCTLVSLTRDPYAICASWAKRYPGMNTESSWIIDPPQQPKGLNEDEAFYWTVGMICGYRLKFMQHLSDRVDLALSYEGIIEDVPGTADRLKKVCPILDGIEQEVRVKVKDYAPQPLTNMNDRQISKLSPRRIEMITAGLTPFRNAVEAAGYQLRPSATMQ